MTVYLLTRKDKIEWNEYTAKVVIAPSVEVARALANEEVGDEGHIWTDPTRVDCEKVSTKTPRVLLMEALWD